jgi:hypothetical protein
VESDWNTHEASFEYPQLQGCFEWQAECTKERDSPRDW